MSTQFERRPSLTSYEVEKAVEFERDNKFAKATGRSKIKERQLPEMLQLPDDTSRPVTTAERELSSVDHTPLELPFAGIRDQGKIRAGIDKLIPQKMQGIGRRVTIAENIQKLGLNSPFSPASPASPSTLRSPLRFFRRREDLRDSIIATTESSREKKPPQVLRERVKDEGVIKMDLDWERHQRRGLRFLAWNTFVSIWNFFRDRFFSNWGTWFRETFAVGEEDLEKYKAAVRAAPLHHVSKLRALESILNLSYSTANQLVMIQNDMLMLLISEIRRAHDGSQQQAVALAIVRNLCAYSGYRIAAAKEVAEILIAVCWAVEDNTCKQHALGALANLATNERPGELLLEQNVTEVLLYLCPYGSRFAKLLTDPERHVRCLALMALYNLSVVPKNRHRLIRSKALEVLQPLLQEPALVGLLATMNSMHLITQMGHPMLIFSERQRNVPEIVRCRETKVYDQKFKHVSLRPSDWCLEHALEGKRLYGIIWSPRHVLHAIETMMLFEPNHRQLVKSGVDNLLVKVMFGQSANIREKTFMDLARCMRSKLAPLVLKLNKDRRGEMTKQEENAERSRRAALIGRAYVPRPGFVGIDSTQGSSAFH